MDSIQPVVSGLTQQIVRIAHPLRIILFGSASRGEMGPDSDIDLLVVVPDGTHRRRTAHKLYREIRNVGFPFDLVIATPSDLKRHKDNIGLIYRYILREGRELYAA